MTQKIRVSNNHRYLTRSDGTPFFYLGDTAWELFHRLTLPEACHYPQTVPPKASPSSRPWYSLS